MEVKDPIKINVALESGTCCECNEPIERSDFITYLGTKKYLCLACSDLSHLVFLPSGDVALTRRAQKHSKLYAVVWEFSKSRKRSERQGILVTEDALLLAEKECKGDKGDRENARDKARIRESLKDSEYIKNFALKIRELFPGCPRDREFQIADHACQKHTNRVGRSSQAKLLNSYSVSLAVWAYIRHSETPYEELLMEGIPREVAREQVKAKAEEVMAKWQGLG